jgi:hypothetical protein
LSAYLSLLRAVCAKPQYIRRGWDGVRSLGLIMILIISANIFNPSSAKASEPPPVQTGRAAHEMDKRHQNFDKTSSYGREIPRLHRGFTLPTPSSRIIEPEPLVRGAAVEPPQGVYEEPPDYKRGSRAQALSTSMMHPKRMPQMPPNMVPNMAPLPPRK